ncbi:DUF3173 family protein [Streptococcus suis]
MIATVTKDDLVKLGFSKGTSIRIIREGKQIMVNRGFSVYSNKRIGNIPATLAEEMLGIPITEHIQEKA